MNPPIFLRYQRGPFSKSNIARPAFQRRARISPQPLANEQPVNSAPQSFDLQPPETKPESSWLTVWWPGLLWLLGAGLVAGRAISARLLLAAFRLRHPAIEDSEFLTRFYALARQLGIRRAIQVIEVPSQMSPFAFGIIRPVIALPTTFVHDLDRAKQEVMLAHELAHVAGRDPLWLLAADLMTALLWWHPLSWGTKAVARDGGTADLGIVNELAGQFDETHGQHLRTVGYE